MVKTEKALDYFCGNDFRCLAQSTNFHPCFLRELRLRAGQLWVFRVLLGRQWLDDWTCSHRLRGLPSSSGSPSLLHLRALEPQRHMVSSWQRTVEPQPPPHAHSVVAWPIARQGLGQWPTNPSILVQTCHVVEVTLFTPSRQVHTTTAKAWRSSPRT